MDFMSISIIALQITNILVSAFVPVLANFSQTITSSDCCGMKIRRKITDKLSKSNIKSNINDKDGGDKIEDIV